MATSRRHRGRLSRGPTRRAVLCGASALAAQLRIESARGASPEALEFADLYKSFGVRGVELSDRLVGLKGRRATLKGFMAPPLKPETDFFVLTREPVSICPFCSSDAEWPVDIVVVYLAKAAAPRSFADRLAVTGTVEIGAKTDANTGFVSLIRFVDAEFRPA